MKPGKLAAKDLEETARNLLDAMPQAHIKFLETLDDSFEDGDYFFTHAGINPDSPLAQQKSGDLRWIRGPFIDSTALYEKVIVHGHTIIDDVALLPNRIAVDTGAYYSGKLSCIVLEGSDKRILHT